MYALISIGIPFAILALFVAVELRRYLRATREGITDLGRELGVSVSWFGSISPLVHKGYLSFDDTPVTMKVWQQIVEAKNKELRLLANEMENDRKHLRMLMSHLGLTIVNEGQKIVKTK